MIHLVYSDVIITPFVSQWHIVDEHITDVENRSRDLFIATENISSRIIEIAWPLTKTCLLFFPHPVIVYSTEVC